MVRKGGKEGGDGERRREGEGTHQDDFGVVEVRLDLHHGVCLLGVLWVPR